MTLVNMLEDKLNDEFYGKEFDIEDCDLYTIKGVSVSNDFPYAIVSAVVEIQIDFETKRIIFPKIALHLDDEDMIGEFGEQIYGEVFKSTTGVDLRVVARAFDMLNEQTEEALDEDMECIGIQGEEASITILGAYNSRECHSLLNEATMDYFIKKLEEKENIINGVYLKWV